MAGESLIAGLLKGLAQGRELSAAREEKKQAFALNQQLLKLKLAEASQQAEMHKTLSPFIAQLLGGGAQQPQAPTMISSNGQSFIDGTTTDNPTGAPAMGQGAGGGGLLEALTPDKLALLKLAGMPDLSGPAKMGQDAAQYDRTYAQRESHFAAQQKIREAEAARAAATGIQVKTVNPQTGIEETTWVDPVTNKELRKSDITGAPTPQRIDRELPGGAVASRWVTPQQMATGGVGTPAAGNDGLQPGEILTKPRQPKNSNEAGLEGMLQSAIQDVRKVKEGLLLPNGEVNTKNMLAFFGNIPKSEGRNLRGAFKNAVEARLRMATGAVISNTEWKLYDEVFTPSPFDNAAGVAAKLQRLEDFNRFVLEKLAPGDYKGLSAGAALGLWQQQSLPGRSSALAPEVSNKINEILSK